MMNNTNSDNRDGPTLVHMVMDTAQRVGMDTGKLNLWAKGLFKVASFETMSREQLLAADKFFMDAVALCFPEEAVAVIGTTPNGGAHMLTETRPRYELIAFSTRDGSLTFMDRTTGKVLTLHFYEDKE